MTARTGRPDTSPILVTGGTGTIGRPVVARLREAGREVRVLSRGQLSPERLNADDDGVEFLTADLGTGEGTDTALDGVQTIVHLAGSPKGDKDKARHLIDAATRAGTVKHIVYISVVGADSIPIAGAIDRTMFGYFGAKRAAERVVSESGLPWSTLRATQVHDLTFKTVQAMAKIPIVPVPSGFRFQQVDAGEVADRLVELALGTPLGLVPAIGGPRVYSMSDLVRNYLQAIGLRRILVPLPLPGAAARAFRAGANLAPERAVGRRTWEEFLAAQVGRQRDRRLAAT